jgi:hypothetical protein
MNIAVYTFAGVVILFVVRIFARHYRTHTDLYLTNSRFESLKAHEQEVIMHGRVVSTK